jgi:NAD(P)-dependent dehydrogenase (short-subunit alcohol dehydrogenase family)
LHQGRSKALTSELTMPDNTRPFAIVAGASSGIGLEIARIAAAEGYESCHCCRRAGNS